LKDWLETFEVVGEERGKIRGRRGRLIRTSVHAMDWLSMLREQTERQGEIASRRNIRERTQPHAPQRRSWWIRNP
jgi:hypothetical protein